MIYRMSYILNSKYSNKTYLALNSGSIDVYKSFDFEGKKYFDMRGQQVKYEWCWQVAARKLRCLPKLFFIRDVHINFFIKFYYLTQKFLGDYTAGLGLLAIVAKNFIFDV